MCRVSNGTRKGCTALLTKTPTQEHGWINCRNVLPPSVRKADPDVDLYNVSTYQWCSILFKKHGYLSKGRMKFGKLRILISRFLRKVQRYQRSLLVASHRNNYAHVILTAESDSLPKDADNRNGHAAIFREVQTKCCVCHLHHKLAMNSPTCTRTLRNRASTSVSLQG